MDGLTSRRAVVAGALWLVVTGLLVTALVRDHAGLDVAAGVAGAAYAIVLIIWLARGGRVGGADPEVAAPATAPTRRGSFPLRLLLCVVVLAVVLVIGLVVGTAAGLIGSSAIAAIAIAVFGRRRVKRRDVAWGLAAGAVAASAHLLLGDRSVAMAVFVLMATPPLFIAGALLRRPVDLGAVRVLDGAYSRAASAAAVGALLAVPLGLFNLFGDRQSGDDWVRHWWQPLAAIEPAIFEETWAQLFLLTLVYVVLRGTGPRRALVTAVILAALAHGLAHSGINPVGIVIGALLFSVPAALLYVRRDLEHAVGYHFTIDAIRYTAAYLAVA